MWDDNFFLLYELGFKLAIAFILFGTYVVVRYIVGRWLGQRVERRNMFSILRMSMESDREKKNKKIYNRVLLLTFGLVVLNTLMYSLVDILGGR